MIILFIHVCTKIYWTSGKSVPGRKYNYGIVEKENKIWFKATRENHGKQSNQNKQQEQDILSSNIELTVDKNIKEINSGIEKINSREPVVNNDRKESGNSDQNLNNREPVEDNDRKENGNDIQNSNNLESVVSKDKTENDDGIHNLNNHEPVVDKDGKENGNDIKNPNILEPVVEKDREEKDNHIKNLNSGGHIVGKNIKEKDGGNENLNNNGHDKKILPRRQVMDIDCKGVIQGDKNALEYAKKYQRQHSAYEPSDKQMLHLAANCSMLHARGYMMEGKA